jgi:23S rRNA G2445 N2-methylase RlmL
MRRPFIFDLVYPIPELKPLIGKLKKQKEPLYSQAKTNLKAKKKVDKRFKQSDRDLVTDTEIMPDTSVEKEYEKPDLKLSIDATPKMTSTS